jgi:hypothetical protein
MGQKGGVLGSGVHRSPKRLSFLLDDYDTPGGVVYGA